MKKKFFLKRLLSLSRLMIIPNILLLLVIGTVVVCAQKAAVEEMSVNYLQIFAAEQHSSIESMDARINAMLVDSSQRLQLKELLGEGYQRSQAEQVLFTLLKRIVKEYEASHPFVDSVYIYVDGKKKFYNSATGLNIYLDRSSDQQWYDLYLQNQEKDKITIYSRTINRNIYDKEKDVLTYLCPMTYMDGVIVQNVDKAKLIEVIRSSFSINGQNLFLCDGEGTVLCSTDKEIPASEMENLLAANTSILFENDSRWMKLADEKYYYVAAAEAEGFDMFLVSCIPLHFLLLKCLTYLCIMLPILAVNIFLVVFLAYQYTQKSFHYIEEYINIFSSAERGEKINKDIVAEEDEYGVILNNIIFLYLQNTNMQKELKEKQHQNEITEMKALQLQINPHFIFNTLQVMDFECIRSIGVESALHHMMTDLIKILKYSLSNPTEYVTLREEMDYLEAFLSIERNRHKNRFITYFDMEEDVTEERVFKLMLQPVVENCFKHGLRTDGNRMVISIQASISDGMLDLAVTDNGRGISQEKLHKIMTTINDTSAENIGLTNLNRRIKIHYGEAYGLTIQSEPEHGTTVSITIPCCHQ